MFRACSPYLTSFCAKASIVVDPWNFSVPEFSRNRRDVQKFATLFFATEENRSVRSQFDLAMLLSIEAGRAADTYEARNAQVTLAQSLPNLVRVLQGNKNPLPGVSLLHPLAISADGQYSVTNFLDKPVLMQQTGSGVSRKWTERSFSASSNFFAAAFSPDGKYLAADSRNGLQLWMLPDAHPLPTLREDGTPAGGTPL